MRGRVKLVQRDFLHKKPGGPRNHNMIMKIFHLQIDNSIRTKGRTLLYNGFDLSNPIKTFDEAKDKINNELLSGFKELLLGGEKQ